MTVILITFKSQALLSGFWIFDSEHQNTRIIWILDNSGIQIVKSHIISQTIWKIDYLVQYSNDHLYTKQKAISKEEE